MVDALQKIRAAFSLFDCKNGKNAIFAATMRELCISDFPERTYMPKGTKVRVVQTEPHLVVQSVDSEKLEAILHPSMNPFPVDSVLQDPHLVLPLKFNEEIDESKYRRQHPAPNPINTSSPPLETDDRRRHCHIHKRLLYPEEICLECINARDLKNRST